MTGVGHARSLRWTVAGWAVIVVAGGLAAYLLISDYLLNDLSLEEVPLAFAFFSFAVVGAVLMLRVPGHRLGPLVRLHWAGADAGRHGGTAGGADGRTRRSARGIHCHGGRGVLEPDAGLRPGVASAAVSRRDIPRVHGGPGWVGRPSCSQSASWCSPSSNRRSSRLMRVASR